MAIRERKGRARPWQCYWNNPYTGKRESVSFETREEAEKEDSLVKHRLRFERESFRPEEKDEVKEVTLEQAYLLYLREKNFSPKSLQWQLDAMRLALKMHGGSPLAEIGLEDLLKIMATHAQSGIKSTTVRNRMSVLRAVLRWCAEQNFCEMPKFPKLPPADYERIPPPSPEELTAIMQAAPSHIQRVVILGAQIGARVGASELFKLKWQDVDIAQGIVRIHGAKKNLKAPWREVPIRENLIPIMAEWAMEDRNAAQDFIIHYGGKPVTSIKRAWKSTLERAGITRRIRPYDLRHAFATELIAAGADVGTVAKLMGHTTPTMVLTHYQYVMDKQKRTAIESLPDFAYVPKACVQKIKWPADCS